jgi:hypothetical protein
MQQQQPPQGMGQYGMQQGPPQGMGQYGMQQPAFSTVQVTQPGPVQYAMVPQGPAMQQVASQIDKFSPCFHYLLTSLSSDTKKCPHSS